MDGDNEELKKFVDRMPKCVKCGHTIFVHTFQFSHHSVYPKPANPGAPVGCAGIGKGTCGCTGWVVPLSNS